MELTSRGWCFLLVLLFPVLACNVLSPIEPANPTPSLTPVLVSPLPSDTALPVEATMTADFLNTVIPGGFEPTSPALPVIHISQPGPGSSVTSPVEVVGISEPTQHQWLMVEITDATGRVLTEEGTFIEADLGQAGRYRASLSFDVDRDQPGRISVYDVSARDGGLSHLSSAPVMLLASGEVSITDSPDPGEAIYIRVPSSGAEISGGMLEIEGLSAPYLEGSLMVALCGQGEAGGEPHRMCGTVNNILAEGSANKDSSEVGVYVPFAGTLIYTVSTQAHARLVVYTISPRDGGYEHVSSVSILLNP